MRNKSLLWLAASAVFVTVAPLSPAFAAGDDFYHGKVIRVVVGFSAGGGFDTYARLVAR
jgi:tripartite-type tricarboxylate transporter receptor subunit TctC